MEPLAVSFPWHSGTTMTLTSSKQTMRIQASLDCDLCTQGSNGYHALDHIQLEIRSVEHGLHDAVLLAIPLGKGQFDLAVKQATVMQIRSQFIDLSPLNLLSCDPFFASTGRARQSTLGGSGRARGHR
jgi:hypothetical protein